MSTRIQIAPTRTDTLVAAVDAWAADIAAGHDTALLAWRRADVADLNRLARSRWAQLGRLHGPGIQVEGGRTYAAEDRIVTLAPDRAAGTVTSEQLTVTAVTRDRIDAITDEGHTVVLTGAAVDRDHLDHGYARTVHRAQGATVDRTHLIAADGGRELAYLALSRACDRTTIHATADNLDQAIEDLQRDWNTDRRERWLTDTPATPGLEPEPVNQRLVTQLQRAIESSATPSLQNAYARLDAARRDLADLYAGHGR